MKNTYRPRRWITKRLSIAAVCFCAAGAFAFQAVVDAQRRDVTPPAKGGGSPAPQRRDVAPPAPIEHARREVVRTDQAPVPTQRNIPTAPVRDVSPRRDVTPPTTGQRTGQTPPNTGQRTDRTPPNTGQRTDRTPPNTGQRADNPSVHRNLIPAKSGDRVPPQRIVQRKFTKTPNGRRYDNGLMLRKGHPVDQPWQHAYFPRGKFHYPYYSPSYASGTANISPFGFFFGVCAPFVSGDHCYHAPPEIVYVDIPVYSGDNCRGYGPIRPDENYLNRNDILDREPGLANAIDELRECFRGGNIDALVALTDPKIRIAIFLKGKYDYSLDANDFVDLTRDALQSTETISFDLTRIHERAAGVYVVSGKHVYKDHNGNSRTVYVSYVVEDIGSEWTLTQVGTAPDRIQEWK